MHRGISQRQKENYLAGTRRTAHNLSNCVTNKHDVRPFFLTCGEGRIGCFCERWCYSVKKMDSSRIHCRGLANSRKSLRIFLFAAVANRQAFFKTIPFVLWGRRNVVL